MSSVRVDFYLLNSNELSSRWLLACRLLEKAYLRGHQVFVYCDTKQDAEQLDELLWTFKDNSFIPHNLQGEGPEPPPPIQLGYQGEPRGFNDILLNLAAPIPSFYARFRRVMEIVVNDEAAKELSRAHYREYRAKQCELHTHDIEL
ncbi:DNA polymerase III subunit chi [Legionella donaldsonii]|uniref:DNA polymerase III subunit chi n=1 Tax=Legionella donaldsonii TaxID=45060 RepID=A0A378J0L1_9GAMM|nr:DNA polymerase III subunit chi [Legionella donaldsonii]STX41284.1 DNA polymerase III subunit chi [Legionella donaldsonii]